MGYGHHYAEKQPLRIGSKSKSVLNKRFYRYIRKYCPPRPIQVVEIGAGHGFFARATKEGGDHYIGIEPNPVMIELLREQGHEVREAWCPPVPLPSGQFDLVYAGYVLEYLPSPRAAFELLEEIRRVLKPGGIVAIVSSDYMRMKREFWNVSYLVSTATSERRMKQLYYDAGFEYQETKHFAGNLWGPSRFLAYTFYSLYSYRLLDALFGKRSQLDSRFYKLRVTFPEGILSIASAPPTRDETPDQVQDSGYATEAGASAADSQASSDEIE